MIEERFSTLQDVRRLPQILRSKKAKEVFLNENTREAKKILAVEELTVDKLKDVPYEVLAQELAQRLEGISMREVNHLRDDSDYANKLECLLNAYDELKFLLDNIQGDVDE